MFELNYFIIGIIVLVAIIIIMLLVGYTKARPDVAAVISGLSKKPRILIGRAGIRIPFFERADELFLGQITTEIKTDTFIPTNDFINVKIDAVAKVRVDPRPEQIQLACRNFLNKNPGQIAFELQETLQGNIREIVGTMDLKGINQNREGFSEEVMKKAGKDMEALGIEILSCNMQNIIDEKGLISDMGMDNTAQIKKTASISKANADKEVAIAEAKARQEAAEARIAADTTIANKENELIIKKAELKQQSDKALAIANKAYSIEELEQEKTVQQKEVEARIAKAEKEATLKEKEIVIQEKVLAAEKEKYADAEKYAMEKAAEANLIKEQKEAEAIKAKLLAEAEGIKAKGEAEAAAIKAKGEAEAEAMMKKAEAYKQYGEAAIAEMLINVLPSVATEIAKPLSQINDINIYGGGDVSQISGNVPTVMKQVFDTVSSVTGVPMQDIVKANTIQAKTNRTIESKVDADVKKTSKTDVDLKADVTSSETEVDKIES